MVPITSECITVKTAWVEGDNVVAVFDDGHKAVFVPFSTSVFGDVESFRHFYLYRGEERVVEYNGMLSRTPSEKEYKLVKVAARYSRELIVAYWSTASKYIKDQYEADRSGLKWYAWIVTTTGAGTALRSISEGRTEIPASGDQNR